MTAQKDELPWLHSHLDGHSLPRSDPVTVERGDLRRGGGGHERSPREGNVEGPLGEGVGEEAREELGKRRTRWGRAREGPGVETGHGGGTV